MPSPNPTESGSSEKLRLGDGCDDLDDLDGVAWTIRGVLGQEGDLLGAMYDGVPSR